jgi:DNA-binding MarR family transcriptional regulator
VRDSVDDIIDQWARERPDVDVSAMGVLGRLARVERQVRRELERVFAQHGLEAWEFDVLATLRRSGSPFELTAGELLSSMMIASGTMTNRINRLADRGLVERRADRIDGRIVRVRLTRSGRTLIDRALPDHAANQQRIINALSPRQHEQLDMLLRRLGHQLSDT